ncbi:hypothetical protein HPP92_011971 [Vanilla planifolia]|uniref:U-box domain-containing protein n=1 Tax=Vanilla planifolia TaxID=51239 RepID=A0A835R743_VANPL|nr:hypothetical protein HPP92_011971 [Vanilla planifolia]
MSRRHSRLELLPLPYLPRSDAFAGELCTGITYDRSSIQRWLDSGNNICPATMQPLLSTDLVPNLTLRRLINIWSSSLATGDHNLLPLSDIARFLSDPSANDVVKHQIVSADALRPSSLASLLHSPIATLHETLEPTVAIISLLLSLNLVDTEHKRGLIAILLSNLESTVAALITIINGAATLSSQIAVARVLEAVVSASPPDSEARMLIAEKLDLMAGLVRLIGECDKEAVEVGLQCLMELIGCDPSASSSTSLSARKVRTDMARAGIVPTLTLVLERDAEELLMPAGERAMRAMEAMAECAEGRGSDLRRVEEMR